MSTSITRPRTNGTVDMAVVLAVVLGLVLGLVPGISPTAADAAHGPLGPGGFEIDGNLVGAHDWEGLGGEQTADGTGNGDLSFFKAALKESSYPNWEFVEGANAPKADLERVLVQSQLAPEGSFIWLGATRVSDEGNVQVTAEFNKSKLTLASMTGAYRQVGDFFIRFNFPGSKGANVDVYVAQWTGSAWGPEAKLTENVNFRDAVGTLGTNSREFLELEINLAGVFGSGGPLACGSFGSVSFRTEASGGNDNNNDPTLKDIAGPFGIDLDTCATVSVRKYDAEDKPLQGAQFTLYPGTGMTGTPVSGTGITNPCTTDATGACSFGTVQPGQYTIDETLVPPGYRKDADLPDTFTVFQSVPVTRTYNDPRIEYAIDVAPDGRNAVGNSHDFLVTLTADGARLPGATVDLSWGGSVGTITAVNGGAAATTCTTRTNDINTLEDEAGTCVVTVTSSGAGADSLSATFTTPYQNKVAADGSSATGGSPLASITDSATKTWVGYHAKIESSATNLVGDAHDFIATVYEIDGAGEPDGVLAPGVTVTVGWSGPAESTIDNTTCVTGAQGTCTFQVNSPVNSGSGTITITQVAGTIAGIGGQADEQLTDTSPTAATGGSLSAVKTWREYRALIDGDSVNPAGQNHTFNVTVQYRDAEDAEWTAAGSGLTVAWTPPTFGSNDLLASTCDNGTDTDGKCTIVVHSDAPGTGSVTVTAVDGDLLADGGETPDGPFDVPDVTASKTWLNFTVDVSPAAVNQVGEAHTFRVEVKVSEAGAYVPVAAGTRVRWSHSDDVRVTTETCSTGTGDDTTTLEVEETNVCFITVNSSTPGRFDLSVTGVDDYQFSNPDRTEDVAFVTAGTSSKTWIAYRASIASDGVNLVGDDHPFTVTAEQNSGSGWIAVPADTTITVTSSGVGTIDSLTCETAGTTGACVVTVGSSVPGDRVVRVDTVEAVDAVDSGSDTADVSAGTNLAAGQSTSATKTWIDYSATISGDATNLINQNHTFRVEAFQDSGSGNVPVPEGTIVGVSLSDDAYLVTDGDGCADGTGNDPGTIAVETNVCFVTVGSGAVGAVTVTVDTVEAVDVDDAPDADVSGSEASATKTWIAVRVDVSDDATNIVGESHPFGVVVTVLSPDSPDGAAAPDGTTVTVTSTGVGRVVEDDETDPALTGSTCDEGTSGGTGTCTVVVYSEVSGDRSITVDTVTLGGTSFGAIDMDGTEGVASGNDLDGNKTWRAYRASIASDGLNLVRDEHPFTVTIQQTDAENPTEPDWTAVPEGTTATVTGASITSNDCDAPDGTSGDTGTCTITVNSTSAGTTTVTVSEIGVTHPDDPHVTATVDIADDSAIKTWVAFRGLLSADSVNVTGDDHVFDVLVEYTAGGDWMPVPDGSAVTYAEGGAVGTVADDSCDPTTFEPGDVLDDRVCTITVESDDSGMLELTLTGVQASIEIGELTEAFDVIFPTDDEDELSGILDGFDLDDYSATKTWASYTLSLDPVDAVNLLNGLGDDPERYHTITAMLGSDDAVNAPVGGQTIHVTISGSAGVIAAVDNDDDVDVTDDSTFEGTVDTDGLSATCTTAADGTCAIVIFSATTGEAELNASYEAKVGDSDRVRVNADTDLQTEGIQGATKTWTTYRVTVTPVQATNLVGNDHVFTVRVEKSDEDGQWLPVVGAVPDVSLDAVTATIATNACALGTVMNDPTTDDVNEAGTCLVTVSSDNVEAVTLTATYRASVGQTTAAFSDQGAKTWIDYAIDVTPETDENLVDTDHVFTVTITTTFPTLDADGKPTTATVPVVGALPAISVSGQGSIVTGGNGCAGGTNTKGQCTVTIRSSAPGSSTLTATHQGAAADDTEVRDYPASGDKLWVDYRLEVTPDAVNTVGDPHTFTATLRRSDDGALDRHYLPVVGAILTWTIDGVGGRVGDAGDVGEDLTCVTDAAGTCDLVINSSQAGATDVSVSYDAVVGLTDRTDTEDRTKQWVDIELIKTAVTTDGFSDGDLIADPGGFPFLAFTSSDQGPKTAVFEYEIHNPSNVTLVDVVLTDDRLGTIDLSQFPACQTLDPGETCVARASEQFDYDAATAALAGLITNIGTVTATGGGEEVSDSDDATITLVAVQSSILIDLVKEVVGGAGDVEVVDGRPTVNWSQAEYEAGVAKTVRYRFTVTNISNAPIIDVELIDPMISDEPIIAVSDGVTLQPDESTVVEVDYLLSTDEAFPDGPIASKVDNVATVTGANETRDSFSQDTDEASVFTELVLAEVLEKEPPLPATGFGAGGLLPVSVLLIAVGAAILWLDRRRIMGR